MPISTLYKLDKIVLPSAVEFSVLRSVRAQAGITSLLEYPAGHPHPMFRANLEQKPAIEFVTQQIDVLLAVAGVGGAALAASTMYFKKAATVGNDSRASTTHRKIVVSESCLYWSNVTLPHNGQGEATAMLMAAYDGVNAPFIYTGTVALSGNLSPGNHFGAGPVAINGVAIPGVQEITIESGVELIQAGASSEIWDTFIGVKKTAPKVTIRTLENLNWATLGLGGTVLDGTNGLEFYARKFSYLGGRVADASAEHIFFQGLLGTAYPSDSNGQQSDPVSDTFVCELISGSDSVYPLVATPLAAIT